MVKPRPGLLDIIHRLRQETELPIAPTRQREYADGEAAAERGLGIDERAIVPETLLCFKRAGADLIPHVPRL